jgi:hypothetical protein
MKYAAMLASKMGQHGTSAWLVNTGCAALLFLNHILSVHVIARQPPFIFLLDSHSHSFPHDTAWRLRDLWHWLT